MGKKILLADDSITIQKVIELTFSDEDFDVVTVGNGRLAIEKVQEVRPDVVLCDVIMPEKDGYEVCDFIKRSPQLGATPVLLLTGAFEPFDQERAARVGCDGFLAKPFEPETLIAKVKDLLSKAAARHAPAAAPVSEPLPPPVVAPPPPAPAVVATPFAVTPVPVAAPVPQPFQAAPPFPAFAPEPLPAVVDEPEMAFIPDEPLEDLDTPSFDAPATAAPEPVSFAPAPDPVDELLPMTAEESESLSGAGDDASATVMFRADSLPWTAPAPPPVRVVEEPHEPHEIAGDLPGFEEIIEEETVVETEVSSVLMSPPPLFVPEPVAAPVPVLPPPAPMAAPPPVVVMAQPPAPAPVVVIAPAPPPIAPLPVVVAAPPPPPVFTPAPPPPPPLVVAPPVIVVAPPVFASVLEPIVASAPPAPPPPPAAVEASSFADVAAEIHEPEIPLTPSVAAQVDVPVDMVAQIAQRVVAQVSEKVVERIAWEVIPELAEALIKREIERLKAELQQLT